MDAPNAQMQPLPWPESLEDKTEGKLTVSALAAERRGCLSLLGILGGTLALVCFQVFRRPAVREQIALANDLIDDFLGLLFPWSGFVIAVVASLLIHHAGHSLGHRLAGRRLRGFGSGPLTVERDLTSCGSLDPDDPSQAEVVAGPAVSFAVGLGALWAALVWPPDLTPWSNELGAFVAALAVASLWIFVGTVIPRINHDGVPSDGARWARLRRGEEPVPGDALSRRVVGWSAQGMRPGDWPQEHLEAAAREADDSWRPLVFWFESLRARDLGEHRQARIWLWRAVEGFDGLTYGPHRRLLAAAAARSEALDRGDDGQGGQGGEAVAARRWLHQAGKPLRHPTEAAVRFAEGRLDEALESIQEAREKLGPSPLEGLDQFEADELDALEERIETARAAGR